MDNGLQEQLLNVDFNEALVLTPDVIRLTAMMGRCVFDFRPHLHILRTGHHLRNIIRGSIASNTSVFTKKSVYIINNSIEELANQEIGPLFFISSISRVDASSQQTLGGSASFKKVQKNTFHRFPTTGQRKPVGVNETSLASI